MDKYKSRIEKVKEFFETCPYLDKNSKFGVDFLDLGISDYVIESTPVTQIVEKYVTGKTKRQDIFVFGSKESFGEDIIQNIENSRVYQKIIDWVEEQNNKGILPDIEGIDEIEILSTPYANQDSENTAKYEFEFKIIYYK